MESSSDKWEQLAKDRQLLRTSVYLFPRPPKDLLNLYDRVNYALEEKGVDMKDCYLLVALRALERDLASFWFATWYVLLFRPLPEIMPPFHDAVDGISVEMPEKWRKVIDEFDEPSSLFRRVPWRDDSG